MTHALIIFSSLTKSAHFLFREFLRLFISFSFFRMSLSAFSFSLADWFFINYNFSVHSFLLLYNSCYSFPIFSFNSSIILAQMPIFSFSYGRGTVSTLSWAFRRAASISLFILEAISCLDFSASLCMLWRAVNWFLRALSFYSMVLTCSFRQRLRRSTDQFALAFLSKTSQAFYKCVIAVYRGYTSKCWETSQECDILFFSELLGLLCLWELSSFRKSSNIYLSSIDWSIYCIVSSLLILSVKPTMQSSCSYSLHAMAQFQFFKKVISSASY